MRYPIVIDKDPDSAYCMLVPDLPGCYTWADTAEEVLIQAVEAIKCHLSGMLVDGEPIPKPNDIEYHRNNPNYACFQRWDWVTVTLPETPALSGLDIPSALSTLPAHRPRLAWLYRTRQNRKRGTRKSRTRH